MNETAHIGWLEDLGVLRFRGPDALSFLQGQLSQDMQRLTASPARSVLAGLHNPQGRALAVLRLCGAGEEVTAVLPREVLAATAATLRRYVLRSKLTVFEEETLVPVGITATEPQLAALCAPLPGPLTPPLRLGADDRWLLLAPLGVTAAVSRRDDWRALDIAAGLPQVYAATSGAFVGQMLNLDCVEAISFTKGCYTGQEVIARAHYRGRVKRRMQRFLSRTPLSLAPGDAGALSDGRTFRVVDAARRVDGRCEFLAVTALNAASGDDGEGPVGATLDCTALPLPYDLPE
jgi:folate-binding protein YgfZ